MSDGKQPMSKPQAIYVILRAVTPLCVLAAVISALTGHADIAGKALAVGLVVWVFRAVIATPLLALVAGKRDLKQAWTDTKARR